jgi:tripartite-type tricarboxylate transporter receptor subunit TctC
MDSKLPDRTGIVEEASIGIGRACAEAVVRVGMQVAAAARRRTWIDAPAERRRVALRLGRKAARCAVVVAGACASTHGLAQSPAAFPEKPVRLIVPLPPGGGADFLARTLAPRLTEMWGQTLVIDNRGGAGGVLGTSIAARSPADGYTIVSGYMAPITVNVSLGKLPYDPVNDLAPLTLAAFAQNVMTVHPAVPATSVKELINLLKAKPGQYNYASAGSGSSPHLSAELFKLMTQTSMNHIPYKGAGPALTDLIAGQVTLYIGSLPASVPHIKSGRVRALAVTGARRSPALADVPTVSEAGVSGFESIQWYGFLAPAKTPAPVLDRLQKDLTTVLMHPATKERLFPQGFELVASTREAFGKYIREDIGKWAKVIAEAKIRAE